MIETQKYLITIPEKDDVSAVFLIPKNYKKALIIAHGAGKDMRSDFICRLHQGLAEQGILTVKFNFIYTEQGRKAPDCPAVLEATWQAVIEAVLIKTGLNRKQLFIAGKSMGGRYATLIAAQQQNFGGIILYGYPLHAPGKSDKPRFEHLQQINSPMLFFQGTRDSLCKLDILKPLLTSLSPSPRLHIIDGGDHSFKVLKKLQRNEDEVFNELIISSAQWINENTD
ncbi:MAG: alpha/beta fold hydrolase [Methylobacter sp.]|nr:alpha/beta fold hydrolase [Methylobacter sp.]